MRITFYGAAQTVTGSQYLLNINGHSLLLECGFFQGRRQESYARNLNFPFEPGRVDAVILSHAHIDHSGNLPNLIKQGYSGPIYATSATAHLAYIMLIDSGHIQEEDAGFISKRNLKRGEPPAVPLYTQEQAAMVKQYFQPVDYDQPFEPVPGVEARLVDAGHILGSASVVLDCNEKGRKLRIWFSGDIGRRKLPLIRDPILPDRADVLMMECTYGDKQHRDPELAYEELRQVATRTLERRGKVIIPAFAVERTQDIIYTLGQFIREGLIPSIPVYIDSPLAISATEIFKKNSDYFDRETEQILSGGDDPLDLPEMIYTRTTEKSKAINEDKGAGIIISASGMCDSGRIKHHLKHHLWQEQSHVVFIGYQGEGTIGRRIVDGAKSVRLFGEEVAIRAHIHTLGGFSAHADQKGLLEWLSHFENSQLEVFVNHGEEKNSLELSHLIHEHFHLNTSVPQWREKRTFFVPEERTLPEKEGGEVTPSEETFHTLFRHLDRNFKRLRKKLRSMRSKGEIVQDPRWLEKLGEMNRKIEEMESEL